MGRDVAELVEPYLSDDPIKWGKLASDVQWRRLQLLLLREILVELRKLNSEGWQQRERERSKRQGDEKCVHVTSASRLRTLAPIASMRVNHRCALAP